MAMDGLPRRLVLVERSGWYSSGISVPAQLRAKLSECKKAGHKVKQVAFGPNGDWGILGEGNLYYSSAIPTKLTEKLEEYRENGYELAEMVFAPNSGWVVRALSNEVVAK